MIRWHHNDFGASGPLYVPFSFQAGSSQVIAPGQILDVSGAIAPLASDKDMSAGILIVSPNDFNIRSGDLAGYHAAIVPRPGDVFEADLATAGALTRGTNLYWSSALLLTNSGSNVIGDVYWHDGYPFPPEQGFQSQDASVDRGTTVRSVSSVLFTFEASNSYWSQLFGA